MKLPFYVITASVPAGNRVTNFHGGAENSASSLLAGFPRFRRGSFDVAIPGWPEEGPEDSLQLRWDDRKVLRLYQDGTLVFRARADYDFLGWGVEAHAFPKFPKLDPLVVVEVNTSFVHRYRCVVKQLKYAADRVFFQLSLHNVTQDGMRLFLTKYFSGGHVDWSAVTRYVAQTDPADERLEVAMPELLERPNAVAYEVVRAFTSLFDMPESEIPFVNRGGGRPEIDLPAIVAM
jgi:hypothetical protein